MSRHPVHYPAGVRKRGFSLQVVMCLSEVTMYASWLLEDEVGSGTLRAQSQRCSGLRPLQDSRVEMAVRAMIKTIKASSEHAGLGLEMPCRYCDEVHLLTWAGLHGRELAGHLEKLRCLHFRSWAQLPNIARLRTVCGCLRAYFYK